MSVNQDDVLRVTAELSVSGRDIQNVMHFRSTNAPIIGNSTALGDLADIMDALYDGLKSSISETVDFDLVRVQNVTADELLGAALWPTLNSGTATGNRKADQVAALLTMPTARPKTRGGAFFGVFSGTTGGPDSDLDSSALAAVLSFGTELLLEQVFGSSSYRYVVYNTVLKTFVLPVAAIAHSAWRTQRRRRAGVGS